MVLKMILRVDFDSLGTILKNIFQVLNKKNLI
jgi:hypothetical protein